MVVKSESSLESKLFIIATTINMDDEQRDKLLSCIVIVENDAAWSEILDRVNRFTILIPTFPINEIKCPRDVNVLFPISKYDFMGKLNYHNSCIDLPKYRKPQFDEMLKLLGYDLTDYASILIDTKRSFPSLYRKITTNPTRREPDWVKNGKLNEYSQGLIRGLLISLILISESKYKLIFHWCKNHRPFLGKCSVTHCRIIQYSDIGDFLKKITNLSL